MLKFRKTNIQVKETTLASERINWTKNFGVQGDTRYGNLNNFSTNGDGLVSSSILTETKQFNYNIGVYLKISLFDVLNRKHQVGLARLEVDEAKSMAQFQEDEIRQNVIRLYQEIILKQRVLKIKSKNLGDGKVNMQMVEKEFRNGIVPVAEYVRITSITTNLEVDYEMARSEFITAKNILEDMAGFLFFN
jgi:outer membrane protein TolC